MRKPQIQHFSLSGSSKKAPGATLHFWPSRETNLSYLLEIGASGQAVAVDVPNGTEMTKILAGRGLELSALLLTHTHHDHVDGLVDLVLATGCDFYSPVPFGDLPRRHVTDGLTWGLQGLRVVAMDTSGHSPLDFSYLFPDLNLCFCGDTLFEGGCGRMFAGPPERFWNSLLRLRSLPEDTLLCGGHDYRRENAEFLRRELPDLPGVEAAAEALKLSCRRHAVPVRLSDQKAHNPFLQADAPETARALNLSEEDPARVFAALRERRNQF